MGNFNFEFQGWAKVSQNYFEASTGGSGSGYASTQRITEQLANSVPRAAERSANHAGNIVTQLRIHADRESGD
jgi:pectate lyase